jgi:hypothetical protein
VPSSVKEIVLRDFYEMIQAIRDTVVLIAGCDTENFYRRTEDCIAGGIVGCYAAIIYAVGSAASSRAIKTRSVVVGYAMCPSPFVISCCDRGLFIRT